MDGFDRADLEFLNPFKKSSNGGDEKNNSSPPETKSPTPPPATANPPASAQATAKPPGKSDTTKPPPPDDSNQSSDSPAETFHDVAGVPLSDVLPPPWTTKSEKPKDEKNSNDTNDSGEKNSPPASSSNETPASSGGDEESPAAEQFSPPAPISGSSETKQPNSNNPVSVSGSSVNPLLNPPENDGVDQDRFPSSGGFDSAPLPPLTLTLGPSQPSSSPHPGVVVGLTLAVVFIIGLIALLLVILIRKTKKQLKNTSVKHNPSVKLDGSQKPPNGGLNASGSRHGSRGGPTESPTVLGGVTFFTYDDLMKITNTFSTQHVIGEGGFGRVFKGSLPSGRPVAVKQLKVGGRQGEKEFRAEVDIISRVHHKNLVSLVGYCISDNERILIYEFVPNSTLEHHLHGTPVLDWDNRVRIALGAARGLAYLHEDCSPKIIHRDIKSANILLDNRFEAKVADFGLAKLAIDSKTHVSTRVMGTFGYMAPEYANSGKLTDRSDVYSFGVVLLELVTGRKPVDSTQPVGEESLVEWARPLLLHSIETGDCGELVDPRLENHYEESKMITMIEAAAACIRHSAPRRPRMVQVTRALDVDDSMSDLSNGLRYGQSTSYDSGQYDEDIFNFRMSRFDSSGESETRAFTSSFDRHRRSSSRGRHFR